MQTKTRTRKDEYLLITVSDTQCTRHFKIPRYLKSLLVAVTTVLSLALVVSNVIVYTQKNALKESSTQALFMEEAFVKLSAKNSALHKSLGQSKAMRSQMSETLAEMEKLSGVSTSMNSPLLERLDAISDHYSEQELDLNDLNGRIGKIEKSISMQSTEPSELQSNNDGLEVESRIDLISLNVSQQQILHDSIPNGYPSRNLGTTSAFGKRIHPTTKEASFHNGVDLRAAEGTQIFATADGVIKRSNYNKLSGKHIIIAHNYGFETRYAHLSKLQVKAGDVVQKGDVIGLSGNTGRSDGPHLHYEVRYLDKAYDPADFLNWEFGDHEIFTKVRGIQWQSLISLINKKVSRPTLQLSQLAPE